MMNMRSIMPALQRAPKANVALDGVEYASVELPKQQRDTRIVKDLSVEQIAQDTERDHFLTAEEAREYGLIDKVIYKR